MISALVDLRILQNVLFAQTSVGQPLARHFSPAAILDVRSFNVLTRSMCREREAASRKYISEKKTQRKITTAWTSYKNPSPAEGTRRSYKHPPSPFKHSPARQSASERLHLYEPPALFRATMRLVIGDSYLQCNAAAWYTIVIASHDL